MSVWGTSPVKVNNLEFKPGEANIMRLDMFMNAIPQKPLLKIEEKLKEMGNIGVTKKELQRAKIIFESLNKKIIQENGGSNGPMG
jgi:hypothetical protein